MAGQIISRGDRTWLVRMFLGRDPNTGKRQYHSHTVHGTKEDARKYLTGAMRDRDLGTFAAPVRITIGELLDDLLADYKANGRDYDTAELNVRVHVRPYFGAMRAARVGTDQVRAYMNLKLEAGLANATVNRHLALVRRAFNLAKKSSPPKVSHVPFIPVLQENNVRKGFFEHEAFLKLRRVLPEEIRPVLTFAYYTGCRKGEILALRWPQVDLSAHVVRLEPGETKNDDARTIPLAPELYEMLVLLKESRDRYFPDCPWVFSRAGKRIKQFKNSWESACKSAGLVGDDGEPANVFHDLRRTGVRNLIRAGVPERVAMTISGHKTRSVFDRYNIVSESDLKDAARKLGDYLAHKGAPEATAASWHTIGTQEQPRPESTTSQNPPKLLNLNGADERT